MIRIANEKGSLVRCVSSEPGAQTLGFHRRYGMVSTLSAERRTAQRRRAGLAVDVANPWSFQFSIEEQNESLDVRPLFGCEKRNEKDRVYLATSQGVFVITREEMDIDFISPVQVSTAHGSFRRRPGVIALAALALILVSVTIFTFRERSIESVSVETPLAQPFTMIYLENDSVDGEDSASATSSDAGEGNGEEFGGSLGFLSESTGRLTHRRANHGGKPGRRGGPNLESGARMAAKLAGRSHAGASNGRLSEIGDIKTSGLSRSGKETSLASTGGAFTPQGLAKLVPLREVETEAGLDPSIVQATVTQHLDEVRGCYEFHGLRGNANLQGRVTVKFEVGADGRVRGAQVSQSSLSEGGVEGCITQKLMNWRFPKPMGGKTVRVKYPFLFRPVGL